MLASSDNPSPYVHTVRPLPVLILTHAYELIQQCRGTDDTAVIAAIFSFPHRALKPGDGLEQQVLGVPVVVIRTPPIQSLCVSATTLRACQRFTPPCFGSKGS